MTDQPASEPNVIYGVDFKNKRKPTPALSLDSPIEVLYETTLGYLAPYPTTFVFDESAGGYVAPESDPA